MKIVLVAPFVCEQSVGEGNSAYHWVSRIARRFDVTLLTYNLRGDRPASQQGLEARVVEWLDLPFVGRFHGLNSQLTPGYALFFLRCRAWIKKNFKRGGFELIHQLAPLALRYPCPAVGLGLPFLVGPLGGSLEAPVPLRSVLEREPLYRKLRRLDRLRIKFDPWLRETYRGARALIVVAPYVTDLLSSIPDLPPVHFMSEAGIERSRPPTRSRDSVGQSGPRLLFVGRVIRTKGVREAIHALRFVKSSAARLDVVGGGEDLEPCRRLASELGLTERVRFHGHVPREAVDAFYERADLFLFPSFREPSGKAVLEALSHGLPVIAVKHGGPAMSVDPSCGRLVEPAPSEDLARSIAGCIDEVLDDPQALMALGSGALARIDGHYTWDKKVAWLSNLYGTL